MAYVQSIYTVYIVHISRASRFDLPTRALQQDFWPLLYVFPRRLISVQVVSISPDVDNTDKRLTSFHGRPTLPSYHM